MTSKDSDNSKARQLYKFPKLPSQDFENQKTDSYGFITKNNSIKPITERKKDILKWEEILRKNCQICLSENDVGMCEIVNNSKKEKNTHDLKNDLYNLNHNFFIASNNSINNQIRFNNIFFKPKNIIESLIFKGIPLNLKGRVWKHMLKKKGFKSIETSEYMNLKNRKSGFEYQIHVDIQRTFRGHKLFAESFSEGQCKLFRVLVAYSNYNPSVGYCQGMASFVGLLLMYFSEYDCFNMLINILIKLSTLFDHDLSLLTPLLTLQKEMLILVTPEIFYILKNENVDLRLFVYSWYLTLFSRFDIKLTLRIWDIFIFYGPGVLLGVCCGILSYHSKKISNLKGEGLVKYLSTIDMIVLSESEIEEIVKKIKCILNEIDLTYIEKRLFQTVHE